MNAGRSHSYPLRDIVRRDNARFRAASPGQSVDLHRDRNATPAIWSSLVVNSSRERLRPDMSLRRGRKSLASEPRGSPLARRVVERFLPGRNASPRAGSIQPKGDSTHARKRTSRDTRRRALDRHPRSRARHRHTGSARRHRGPRGSQSERRSLQALSRSGHLTASPHGHDFNNLLTPIACLSTCRRRSAERRRRPTRWARDIVSPPRRRRARAPNAQVRAAGADPPRSGTYERGRSPSSDTDRKGGRSGGQVKIADFFARAQAPRCAIASDWSTVVLNIVANARGRDCSVEGPAQW